MVVAHRAACLALVLAAGAIEAQDLPESPAAQAKVPAAPDVAASAPTRTFVPVPEIDLDPNAGTTLGLIGVWLQSDAHGEINRIYAPDVIHNPNFGWGARARIFAYPSNDAQWSVVAGAKQHVESEFDALYEHGRTRQDFLSYSFEAVWDRSGSPRFFGIGNDSHPSGESVYTNQQYYLAAHLGLNFTHAWQLGLEILPRSVTVLPGQLPGIPSTTELYPDLRGLGETHALLTRLLVRYDTRDDLTMPTRGGALVLYGGLASEHGLLNDSLYSEAGTDVRWFWSPSAHQSLALHAALRYLPSAANAPFWALSSLGGDQSLIGDRQLLRGYGAGRFTDRNVFSASFELRQQVATIQALATHIELQLTPFLDSGEVFHESSDSPVAHLHNVLGIGVRAVARPSVVGYVDIGKGSEGVVAFSGLDYPF
jgi:hypothetical protein